MLARNTKPTRAQRKAINAIGMGHDDLAHYVTNPELLSLLEPYRFTYGYVGAAGSPTSRGRRIFTGVASRVVPPTFS